MMETIRVPLKMEIFPYLRDHTFGGESVLPAVEALQWLACSTREKVPGIHVQAMYQAAFPRFLHLAPEDRFIEACNEMDIESAGNVTARLVTRGVSRSGTISRTKVHAQVSFRKEAPPLPQGEWPSLPAFGEGVFEVPADRLYRDLVPLGPSYRNAGEPIRLHRQGATAHLHAPGLSAGPAPLGSPFPMDAAMHCACAWSQRYAGVVAFPTGFEKRVILQRTVPGEVYMCRIVPVPSDDESLVFHIGICRSDGVPYEMITSVKMRDVSAGRLTPPRWILDIA